MIRGVYSLVMSGAKPWLRRKLRRRGVAEPGYLDHVEERFGRYHGAAEPGRLWIHAVSLGETRAAAILLGALRKARPHLRVLLTHGTATGRAEGMRLLGEGDAQAWLPWDTPQAVAGFLDHFKPCAGVLMETEVWPNLTAACARSGIPLVLANARMSDKTLRQTLRLALLARPAYAALAAVWAQTEADAHRLGQAGARVSGVLGNLKFDAQPDAALLARGRQWRSAIGGPVVALAVSREGEEAEFFRLIKENLAQAGMGQAHDATNSVVNQVRWLVVPRHPQRFEEVAALAAQHGLTASRRSGWDGSGPGQADVWIGDSLGEMPLYYGLADVALLGGSFAPLGGQNLIEAAACGCPVVMGPHTFNFAEAAGHAQSAGAALRVSSMHDGMRQALAMVNDPQCRNRMSTAATTFAGSHRGAAERMALALHDLIRTAPAR